MTPTTHVRLANDVAAQFSYLPDSQAVLAIAGHLRMFWEPRMRASLREALRSGDDRLDPLAARAAAMLH